MHNASTTRRTGILLVTDVETLLDRSKETLRDMVRRGVLPRPRQCGSLVFWLEEDLLPTLAGAPPADKWPGPGGSEVTTEEEIAAA